MKSRWVSWKGRQILVQGFNDFGHDVAALEREVSAIDGEIVKRPPGSILALADLRGTVTGSAAVNLFKHSAARTRPFIARQAIVGIGGVQRFLAQMVSRASGQGFRLFDSSDEAMDWLVGRVAAGGEPIEPREAPAAPR